MSHEHPPAMGPDLRTREDSPSGQHTGPVHLGLVIADDHTLACLNKDYRGVDEVTDVLAFAWQHQGHWEGDGQPPLAGEEVEDWPAIAGEEDGSYYLGEVIVSYPQAQRQAAAQGHTTERELAILIVHGILHLAGYDHLEPEDEVVMKAREGLALTRLFGQE